MCQDQTVPSKTRIERLQSLLAAAGQTSRDGQDIFALDRGVVGSNDQVVEGMSHIMSSLNVNSLEEGLLNRGRIRMQYYIPSDYEDIFECFGLSRRSVRLAPANHNSIPVDLQLLIEDWTNMCLDDPSMADDKYTANDMTMSCFHELMNHGMPAKLDLSSWVAKVMLNIVAEDFPIESLKDCFCEWEPWMGTDHIRYPVAHHASFTATLTFLGEAQPGRLVWAPMIRGKAPCVLGRGYVREIENMIRNAEAALVALARRIARQVVHCILFQYAAPQAEERGYGILTRKEIGRDVR